MTLVHAAAARVDHGDERLVLGGKAVHVAKPREPQVDPPVQRDVVPDEVLKEEPPLRQREQGLAALAEEGRVKRGHQVARRRGRQRRGRLHGNGRPREPEQGHQIVEHVRRRDVQAVDVVAEVPADEREVTGTAADVQQAP